MKKELALYRSTLVSPITTPKNSITQQGKVYYSQVTAAKMLGMTISVLRKRLLHGKRLTRPHSI